MTQKTVIYVDVDETFVRGVGTKRIPMTSVIRHIRGLKEQGVVLYCWYCWSSRLNQPRA